MKFAIPFKEHLKPTNPNTSKYIYNNISLFFLVAFPLLVGDRCHQLIKNRYTQKGLGTLKLWLGNTTSTRRAPTIVINGVTWGPLEMAPKIYGFHGGYFTPIKVELWCPYKLARWWFQIIFLFTAIPREMIQFDEHIFQTGLVQPPPSLQLAFRGPLGRTASTFTLRYFQNIVVPWPSFGPSLMLMPRQAPPVIVSRWFWGWFTSTSH